ncbi:hypothetical protein [Streptomyces puniciscabiei]|uniref:hypothetical protein n=1 Tax=Streptomyces puniciscabiei TaxID=164348 RepID=UPI0037A56F8E
MSPAHRATTVPRTTPPRPVDMAAVFPELAAARRPATRLHPRRGTPTAYESSVGGPMLWPADEPWPVCTVPHKRHSGHRYGDVLREREITERAQRRDARGTTPEEDRELAGFRRGRPAPHLTETDPVPLIAVAQLYRRDVPGLPDPGLGDLLQVFWCGYERHGESRHEPYVHLRWRHSRDVGPLLAQQPVPEVVGCPGLVPAPCVLHPEEITELPWFEDLDLSLQDRIAEWAGPEDEGDGYVSDLSTAPGWKVGGHIAWNLTGPASLGCLSCGAELFPLLTAASCEWDSSTTSWIPYEDRPTADAGRAWGPTEVSPGRGRLVIAVCPGDPQHPIRLISQ